MPVTTVVRTIAAAASAACLSLLVLSATPLATPASPGATSASVLADGGTVVPPAGPNDTHWG